MNQHIILGVGTGFCGSRSLARVLNQQPAFQVSVNDARLLPWKRPAGVAVLPERLARWRKQRDGQVLGDVGSSYLPYVEELVALEPAVRIVCLKRPREEVVTAFCQWLDDRYPLQINHWAEKPAAEWHHDPLWTRCYPQYDTPDREEGLRRYWTEYYGRAEELAKRFPQNFRIFDMLQALNTEAGQREVLAFVGVPPEKQVLAVGAHVRPGQERLPRPLAKRASRHPMDPRKCVILVPFHGSIMAPCEAALRELERRGYDVRRVGGYAAIDQGRNQMTTDALIDGYEETMWIDADTDFHPDVIDRLRGHDLPLVAGICAQKGKRAISCHIVPGTPKLTFGKGGGLVELLYAGTGFIHIRREVYLTVQRQLQLPMCNERLRLAHDPFFQPMLHPIEDGHWYLAEDYAFSQRVRQCGIKIMGDTAIRLWHMGNYSYGWEDAGMTHRRFHSFTLNFPDQLPPDHLKAANHRPPRRARPTSNRRLRRKRRARPPTPGPLTGPRESRRR